MDEARDRSALIGCAVEEPALLGESPFWHGQEQALYYCDIAGHELRRFDPASRRLDRYAFDTDAGCCAPIAGGGILLGLRSGFWSFDHSTGAKRLVAEAPYDPAEQRYNDGKCDGAGRMWCGTICESRAEPLAALYCLERGRVSKRAGGATVSNGLAWSPDRRTMYWADTSAHAIYAFDFDVASGAISKRRVFARFPARAGGAPLDGYGGRPDGAAVDEEGRLWVAMYEGQRLVRLDAGGRLEAELKLPVRCPTMPCFGGADLRTLYITTARQRRPADELAAQPWAGCVLELRVDVPGLPANFYVPYVP